MTAVLFALSGVARVYAITDAAMNTSGVEMENSMSDHGMECGGFDNAAHAACVAICATAAAILNEPIVIPFVVAMQDNVAASEVSQPSGRPSPEPPPPKR